jgi:hypothetical protein
MDYKNGKIYSLRSPHTDKVYVGSTTQPLFKRLSKHRGNYYCWKRGTDKRYNTSFEIFDYGDAFIELIEEYPCENKMLLNKREGEIIRSMECVNKVKNGGINKRGDTSYYNRLWREQNKEKVKQYKKDYREKNKDKINEYQRKYYHGEN